MLAAIASIEADPLGHVLLQVVPGTTAGATSRRMSRIATLDGGAALNDSGYSEADRIIDLRWQPVSEQQEEDVARLVRLYGRVHVSFAGAVFLAAPETYTPGQESQILLLVLGRV